MELAKRVRAHFPMLSIAMSLLSCCICVSTVNGTGVFGAIILVVNILSLMIYISFARVYQTGTLLCEKYQSTAMGVTWCTAYQCGLVCVGMDWPVAISVIAYLMFFVEWFERTKRSFGVQDLDIETGT